MRQPRLLGTGRSHYHVLSRVVDRRFIFNRAEKNFFRKTMRKLEAFLGVKVLTYCIMSNHFHILLEVPDPDEVPTLTKDTLLALLPILYKQNVVDAVKAEFDQAGNNEEWIQRIMAPYQDRMGKLHVFMRELKQRFTQWYNRNNDRTGTLWEDRYKSVLVEGDENALLTMAAYIDLNPVRAGMVSDPKDYQWSGYGEAIGGNEKSREGLGRLLSEVLHGERLSSDWSTTSARYRELLYLKGIAVEGDSETGQDGRVGFSREAVEKVLAAGGKFSKTEILRCRVRYFCDGAIFGSKDFVEEVFAREKHRYGAKRKTGARVMKGADWGDLRSLRDLQRNVIS